MTVPPSLTRAARIRTLKSILAQAEKLRPASEAEDEQMYHLIGGIIVNAEDAIGALESEARWDALAIAAPAALANLSRELGR